MSMRMEGYLPPARDCASDPDVRRALEAYDATTATLPENESGQAGVTALERLGIWAETAGSVNVEAVRQDIAVADASRHGCIGSAIIAGDNASRALRYLENVTGGAGGRAGAAAGDIVDGEHLTTLHEVLHRGGLARVVNYGVSSEFTPGMTRTWQDAVEDIRTGERHGFPQPGTVLPLLRRWQSDYAHAAWDRPAPGRAIGAPRHAQVLRAAQAFSSLQSIRPFPDGNGRICRLLAHGILRQGGYPASGLSAVMERHRPTCNARLMDVMRSGDQTAWTKAFIGFAEEGARTIADQIPAMASAQQALAGRIAAGTPEQRAAIAADMLTTPFDRPAVFSKRHGLDKETTEAILKPLVRSGDLELGRINGHQVMMLPVGLEMLRELTRRQPQADRDPDTRTRDGERAPRRDPDPRL